MLRIDHRESRDIDIFLNDPQQLAFLDPTKRDFDFEIPPSGHTGDGARFLKLAFASIGEIDFIVAGSLTSPASTAETINGQSLALETVLEIIAKKIHHRGSAIAPRDIFDIAAAGERHADSIIRGLREHGAAVGATLAALDGLNPEFVDRAISQLAIKPGFEAIARTARNRAREIMQSVVS